VIGEFVPAIRELRTALRLARTSGVRDREIDVLASLGATLARAGRTEEGLAALDRAVQHSHGAAAGRVLLRRADVLMVLTRYAEALNDLRGAITRLRRAGDTVWEARSLSHRAFTYLAVGQAARADGDFVVAERLFASCGQDLEYAMTRHNRGLVAFARGDLPAALTYLDEAGQRYEALRTPIPELAFDRCRVFLAAGLAREALQEADNAAGRIEESGPATTLAELLLTAASAALASGEPDAARTRAERAHRLFQAQHRERWAARTELIILQARYTAGDTGSQELRRAERASIRLEVLGVEEAPRAHLLTGRIALARGERLVAEDHLARAARFRRRGPPLGRSASWLAQALLCSARGNVRATLAACSRGLDALDEHRLTLGATELRAHATTHGAELAMVAQREALRRRDARRLLAWSERWRATALAVPAVRPPDDEELVAELAALRDVVRRLEAARAVDLPVAPLARERRRLEAAVRARTMRTHADDPDPSAKGPGPWMDLDALFTELGDACLVELVDVDGLLHAVVAGNRRVRLRTVGKARDAAREVEMARFALRRMAHGRQTPQAGKMLGPVGQRLEEALLGRAAAELGDGGVVVVPPARLHAVPWGMLPSLTDRLISVVPSAWNWLRAARLKQPLEDKVALVAGPGLDMGPAEVSGLVGCYPNATVLGNGSATAERVLAALDGARLAHIAAHGSFRADSPLFSALWLDDGPMTVHDFERLHRAPYRLVLSACDSGVGNPVGADELLGLVSGLVPLGAAGILASVVPVNDAAAAPLMLALHRRLSKGAGLAEALTHVRAEAGDDPVARATVQSFIALGV
jgi:tetratricopeptide (TPR) repeat protein